MSNTLSDKTNKSIADIANKIMQEQPTKIRDFADSKPIESDMVQRVMNLKVPNHFVKEETKSVWDSSLDIKAHGDQEPTHTVHLLQSPKGTSGWRGSPRTLKVHVAAKDDAEAIQHATTAASDHHDNSHDSERWEKPFVPSNPAMMSHPVKRLKEGSSYKSPPNSKGGQLPTDKSPPNSKGGQLPPYKNPPKSASNQMEEAEQIDELSAGLLHRYRDSSSETGDYGTSKLDGNPRRKGIELAGKKLNQTPAHKKHYADYVASGREEAPHHVPVKVLATRKEEVEQIDEAGVMKKVGRAIAGWGAFDKDKPKDVVKNTKSMSSDALSRIATAKKGSFSLKKSPAALQQKVAKRELEKRSVSEEVEQIDEARFGKAIDRSKLSAAARARLEARDKKAGKEAPKAEPAPTSAAVGKRAGRAAPKAKESPMAALAQSFGAKKKAAPNAAPEKEETPAQKVRRQNIERQKEFYAKGGSGGINVGSGGRTSITGHNTSTAGGAVNAVKSQGRIKTGGLHSIAVDEELKGNQTALDVAKPYGKLTAQDFKALRAKHKKGN